MVQSESDKTNPWLPDGVVCDILRHLPVKSLLRLQSVSKTWRSIIHHRDFVKSYRRRPESRISVVRSDAGNVECSVRCSRTLQVKAAQSLPIQTLITETESPESCTVIGSIDGLFLFQNCPIHFETSSSPTQQLQLLLWNPSIQRFRMLPLLPSSGLGSRTTISVGIGYDPSVQDYKHVRIACNFHDFEWTYYAMIYTLGTNSWRSIPIKAVWVFYSFEDNSQRACFRGVLYMIIRSRVPHQRKQLVLSFDLRTEEFRSVKLPEGASYFTTWYLKCASDGSRLLLVGNLDDNWLVWWATGDGGGLTWTKNYKFSSRFFRLGQSSRMGARDVLNIDLNRMSMSRDESSMVLLLKLEDFVASYDIREAHNGNGKIVVEEKRTSPSEVDNFVYRICAAPYTESLLLLN